MPRCAAELCLPYIVRFRNNWYTYALPYIVRFRNHASIY